MSGRDNTNRPVYDRRHRRNPTIDQPTSRPKKHKNKKAAADHPHSQSFLAAKGDGIRWYDLPLKLAMSLLSNTTGGTLLDAVSSGGVTKSWPRPQPNKCKSSPAPTALPQLQLLPRDQLTRKTSGTLPRPVSFSTSYRNRRGLVGWLTWLDGSSHRAKTQLVGVSKRMVRATGRIPDRLHYCLSTLDDLYLYWGSNPLWNQDADDYPFPRPSQKMFVEDAVVIVLTGLPLPAFIYYRFGYKWPHAWTKQDAPIIDPNCSGENRFMTLHSGIWLRGKLYALSLQGTLVVIERESRSSCGTRGYRVGSMGEQRVVPCAPCKHFREIMVESEGEILLVFLVFRKSMDYVDDLEVYSLDTGKLEWVRLHDLGRRVLIFGSNCCVSVSVAEAEAGGLGCRRNCVYFKHAYWISWFQYDMEMGTINRL